MKILSSLAQRPAVGQTVCGDAVAIIEGKPFVVAIADGLGHGPGAAEASTTFCNFVTEHAEEPLESLMLAANRALTSTRGAAAAILRIDQEQEKLSFVGIGNIELRAIGHYKSSCPAICLPGIVGRPLRRVKAFEAEIHIGDTLALFTDGISTRFELKQYRRIQFCDIASTIMQERGKDHDDATCLVLSSVKDE